MKWQVQNLGMTYKFDSFEEACKFASDLPVKGHFDIWYGFQLWLSYTWNFVTGQGELDVPNTVKVVG